MYIEDRLFSENTEEILYSILLDEDEYTLYSEFCSLFSKDEDEDEGGIDKGDLAKAAAIAAGATGTGAAVGKVLQHQGEKKLKGLVGKRALQGAGINQIRAMLDVHDLYKKESKRLKRTAQERYRWALEDNDLQSLKRQRSNARYWKRQLKKDLIAEAKVDSIARGVEGASLGALEGAIEKHLKEKQLKKLVKKGGKAGLAAGTLAGAGYLAHKASKKKKKD